MYWIVLVGCSLGAPVPPPNLPRLEVAEFVREPAAQERRVLKALSEESLWKDPDRVNELTDLLQAAEIIRSAQILELLAAHIGCIDARRNTAGRLKPRAIEREYPAYGILARVGSPAAAALLKQLRSYDFVDVPDRDSFPPPWRGGAIICFATIYGPGKNGVELAVVRMRQELKLTQGKERENLSRALELLERYGKSLSD